MEMEHRRRFNDRVYFSSSTDIPYVSINSIKFLFLKRMKMVMVMDTTCKAGMLIQCLMWPRWEVPPVTGPNGTACIKL